MEINTLLIVFLGIYFLEYSISLWLEVLNRRHLREQGTQVPEAFSEFIDQEKLARSVAYTLENSRFGVLQEIWGGVVLLALLLSGFLPFLEHLTREWQWPFILSGLFFMIIPGLISSFVGLPFDYYHTFVIEQKYGFNKSTLKVWIMDQVKGGIISLILFSLIFSIILWMIRSFPNTWWLWGCLTISGIQLLMGVLYPVLIAPLFNKFEPIRDQDLAAKISRLMEEAGIRLKGLFQMDAGKRSRHTNAYFTGLGRSKRIVLFDTLIEKHPHEEVLAVLAHEIGHYKKKHIWKQFFFFGISTIIAFYVFSLLLDWPLLYRTFGFETSPAYVGLFLLGILGQKMGFFAAPLYSALSRRYERQADRFALDLLQSPSGMISGLKRLGADNLSNLFPHPWYVRFHYSHPPLLERIKALKEFTGTSAPRKEDGQR
jgi:STE24 endopeptidase